MKNLLLLIILFYFATSGFGQTSVSHQINFESTAPASVLTSSFGNFNGGNTTVIDNLVSGGFNIGGRVARLICTGGANFAGSFLNITPSLDFSTTLTPIHCQNQSK